MGKITISGDSIEEVLDLAEQLREAYPRPGSYDGDWLPEQSPTGAAADEAARNANVGEPKPKRTRKKAEAPDPIQPTAAAPEGANPFTGEIIPPAPEPAAPLTFAPAPEPAPLAFAPVQEAAPVDRPAVARLKQQIDLLAQQHGYAQVMNWVMTTGFSQPAGTDPRDFMSTTIHNFPDEALDKVYKSAGGK